jgi:hypothetical protein
MLDVMRESDLSQFDNIIISLGRNDVNNNIEIEQLEDNFYHIRNNIYLENPACKVFICTVSPRIDNDVRNLNVLIGHVCTEWDHTKIDIENAFCYKVWLGAGTPFG